MAAVHFDREEVRSCWEEEEEKWSAYNLRVNIVITSGRSLFSFDGFAGRSSVVWAKWLGMLKGWFLSMGLETVDFDLVLLGQSDGD